MSAKNLRRVLLTTIWAAPLWLLCQNAEASEEGDEAVPEHLRTFIDNTHLDVPGRNTDEFGYVVLENVFYHNYTIVLNQPTFEGEFQSTPPVYLLKPGLTPLNIWRYSSTAQVVDYVNTFLQRPDGPISNLTDWQPPCVVHKPVYMFSGLYASNFYHFMCDVLLQSFQVLREQSIMRVHECREGDSTCLTPGGVFITNPDDYKLVAFNPKFWRFTPAPYLHQYLGADLGVPLNVDGCLLKKVIIGQSNILNFRRKDFLDQLELQQAALDLGIRWIKESVWRYWKSQPQAPLVFPSMQIFPQTHRLHLTWPIRIKTRRVLNADEVLRAAHRRHKAHVHQTFFQEHLLHVINLMEHTDVFIGMHGAGFTNMLFVKQNASCVQLFPYGWDRFWAKPGSKRQTPGRGRNYKHMALARKCNYYSYFNDLQQNAFFNESHFAPEYQVKYVLHPTPGMKPNPKQKFWIQQNTMVDMATLDPVLEKAFRTAGNFRAHRDFINL